MKWLILVIKMQYFSAHNGLAPTPFTEVDMLHLLSVLIATYRRHMAELHAKMAQFDRMHAPHQRM